MKKYSVKGAMSTKISFMHYMEWEKVMLPVFFEEFELIYIFSPIFFHSHCQLVKGQLSKNLEKLHPPPTLPPTTLTLTLLNYKTKKLFSIKDK